METTATKPAVRFGDPSQKIVVYGDIRLGEEKIEFTLSYYPTIDEYGVDFDGENEYYSPLEGIDLEPYGLDVDEDEYVSKYGSEGWFPQVRDMIIEQYLTDDPTAPKPKVYA